MKRAVVAFVVLLLVAPLPAEAAGKAWSGYRTTPGRTADSGFVGARLVDGQVTYRLDAKRRPGKRYAAPTTLEGTAAARTAWILSKYGGVRVADQAAAVDLATYALMSGRAVDGKRAKRRLKGTGRSAEIRSLARQMLAGAARYAGPYDVAVSTAPVVYGGTSSVRTRVISAAGEPVPNLAVSVLGHTGATDADGVATVPVPADQAGVLPLTVTVAKVPDWRLTVRKARHRRASRIAVVGPKVSISVQSQRVVRGTPTVTVHPPGAVRIGVPIRATFDVRGSVATPQVATASMHGPFYPGETPDCTRPVWIGEVAVNGDGTYTTEPITLLHEGHFVWGVEPRGNDLNLPARTCGPAFAATR